MGAGRGAGPVGWQGAKRSRKGWGRFRPGLAIPGGVAREA